MGLTPLVNGVSYAYANLKVIIAGVPIVGITKIAYKRKQKKENLYGQGVEPTSRGYGNKEYEGSITLYMEEWKRIIAAAPNRDPLDIDKFDIQVVYGGSRVAADKDVLRAVEFTEDDFSAEDGATKIMITVPLIIGRIDR